MKILVISNLYPPFYLGGYEIGCKNIVDGLIDSGHEVIVLTSSSHVRDQSTPIPSQKHVLRRLQVRAFHPITPVSESVNNMFHFEAMVSNYVNTSAVLDVLKEFAPECVYLFNLVGLGGLAIIDILNFKSVPWVIHLMDRVPIELQRNIHQSVLSVFNANDGELYKRGHLISMTQHLVNEIESLSGFRLDTEVSLIPGWVKVSPNLFKRSYLTSGIARFVSAGAVQPHKGIHLILEAVALLKANGIQNFSVEIYGDGNINHYVDMSKQLNIDNFVMFAGSRTQDDLACVYKFSDAFLFPTWEREPFGFAPIEAAAFGCIPIITSTCGVSERLIGDVNCLKIERTAASLSSAMRRFCTSKIDCQRIGSNAQLITRQDLNFGVCLNKIEHVLTQSIKMSTSLYSKPFWKDYNFAYFKHNLAFRLHTLE